MNINSNNIVRTFDVVNSTTHSVKDREIDDSWNKRNTALTLLNVDPSVSTAMFDTISAKTYLDTSFGGASVINPPYGFTTFADIPIANELNQEDKSETQSLSVGMGRYYSEALSDNAKIRTLYITFGVPKITSFLTYYTNAVDYGKIIAARGGTLRWLNLGKAIGTWILARGGLGFFGRIFMMYSWALLAIMAIGKLKKVALGFNDARYYTFSPRPHTYLMSANSMLATFAADRGLIHPIVSGITKDSADAMDGKTGTGIAFDGADTEALQRLIPHLFLPGGFISLPAYIARPQIMYMDKKKKEALIIEKRIDALNKMQMPGDIYSDTSGKLTSLYADIDNVTIPGPPPLNFEDTITSLDGFVQGLDVDKTIDKDLADEDKVGTVDETKLDKTIDFKQSEFSDSEYEPVDIDAIKEDGITMTNMIKAAIQHGIDTVPIQVEYLGSTTATFTNTFKEIPAKEAINSVAGGIRDITFNFSNISPSESVNDFIGGVRDVALGFADRVTGGLSSAVAGVFLGAYYDMPLMWDDSKSEINTHEFKVVCGGPYGNQISLLRDIDIVLACIITGGVPQEAGRSAYTSPLLCQGYVTGGVNIDLGMMSYIRVEVGTGKLAYNRHNQPIQVTITFKIADLSPMIRANTSTGIFGALEMAADEYAGLNRFIGIVSGRTYHSNRFTSRRAIVRASAALFGAQGALSVGGLGSMVTDNPLFNIVRKFFPDKSVITAYSG